MERWQTLLASEWEGVADEYGPHSQAIVSAIQVLAEAPWFENVGNQLSPELNVTVVGSWDEAIGPLTSDGLYGPNGHLLAPSQRCISIIESREHAAWWQRARGDIYDYVGISSCIDSAWPDRRQDFVHEYVYEFISFLFAEIIGASTVGSTYFREMLEWFRAGRFPAGWDGSWPEGRMRIY